MKNPFLIITIGIAVLTIWSLSIPAVTSDLRKPPGSAGQVASNLRQFYVLLTALRDEKKAAGIKNPPFPKDLSELISHNYISKQDYDSLILKDSHKWSVYYFPPESEYPSSNHILFVAHSPEALVVLFANANLFIKERAEHGLFSNQKLSP